jgi:hypothetical protein
MRLNNLLEKDGPKGEAHLKDALEKLFEPVSMTES